ncbi:hypothetical protein [uncultured Duncaniella sp.]|uniref:hypothetical protein n=4 Tax=uncultured Duncaniella sp. TaxID=2768039 RepID=UPI00263A1C2F|nr:hypothetical protein [uncultured Duncaniella sp.]
MKTDGYIFKDSWLAYILYGILLCPFICLWVCLDAFPFGDKGAVGLFIFIVIFTMILAIPTWGIIKHPNRLIIDSDGIHYYCRRVTLSNNSSLWIDNYMFYSWDKIQGFYFEWMSRGVMSHRYLVLEHEHDKAAFIRLNDLTGKKYEYISAIEECSDGRCLLNRAKYDKNRKIRNEILWQTSLIPALIGAALAIILIKLGIR